MAQMHPASFIARRAPIDLPISTTRCSLPRPRALPRSDDAEVSRRTLLSLSGAFLGVAEIARSPLDAWALLPDDDDADLVSKAKARRKTRIQEELAAEKRFVREEGFRAPDSKKLQLSVQNAVYKLALSGDKLESGAMRDVSDLMKAEWVTEFDAAASELSFGISGASDNAKQILKGISSLQSTAARGDVDAAKKMYVEVVSSFQKWTSLVGLQSSLKGL